MHSRLCNECGSDDEREYMKHQLRREIDLDMIVQGLKGKMELYSTLGVGGGYRDARRPTVEHVRQEESGDNPEVKGIAVRKGEKTQEDADYYAKQYSCYFEAVMGVKVLFYFTASSCVYVSMFEACRVRDSFIVNLLTRRPIIWDVMGGSGTDSVGFLCNLHPEELNVVDFCYGTEEERTHEYECVKKNLWGVRDAFPELHNVNIEFHSSTARDFLLSREDGVRVDIVFVDPNWWSGRIADRIEMSPEELLRVLHHEVFEPIDQKKIIVDFYILKTRWPWDKIAGILGESALSQVYHPVLSIMAQPFHEAVDEDQFEKETQVKGRYFYVVLMHSELRNEVWTKSKLYEKLRSHESFVVDTRNYMKPYIPRYSQTIQFHDISDTSIPTQYRRRIYPPAIPKSWVHRIKKGSAISKAKHDKAAKDAERDDTEEGWTRVQKREQRTGPKRRGGRR